LLSSFVIYGMKNEFKVVGDHIKSIWRYRCKFKLGIT